jgi:hypothetical protein
MIEVFKTDVCDERKSGILLKTLREHFPGSRINFDLDDCDKILRAEGKDFLSAKIIELLQEEGHRCEVLD